MSFNNFVPPMLTPQQSGAMPDILGQILGGYNDTTKARYLQPGLEEELKKIKQYNQLYNADVESQIGARNAQAEASKWGNSDLGQLLRLQNNPDAERAYNQMLGIGNNQQSNMTAMPRANMNPQVQSGITTALSPNSQQQMGQAPQQQMQPAGQSQMQPAEQSQMQPAEQRQPLSWDQYIGGAIQQALQGDQEKRGISDLAKKTQERLDILDNYIPGTQRTQQFKNEKDRMAAQRMYDNSTAHLGTDKSFIYNEEGDTIGVQRPFTTEEMKVHRGRTAFNVLQPILSKGFTPYRGKGSIDRFRDDAKNYLKDPAAKQRIDNYLLASVLFSSSTVAEMGTIGSPNTYKAFEKVAAALPHSDVHNIIQEATKQLTLPASAFEAADKRMLDALNNATIAAELIPSYKETYFDPSHNKNQGNVSDKVSQQLEPQASTRITEQDIKDTIAANPGITREQIIRDFGEPEG